MIINTVNAIYQAQLDENELRQRERKPHHYPSSACGYDCDGKFCGACRRATYFSWKGMERTNPIDAPALFKMEVGSIIHEHLSELLEGKLQRDGYTVTDEIGSVGREIPFEWQDDRLRFPFSGRLDGRYCVSGSNVGIEWKSVYGKGADAVNGSGPKEDALLQCAIYLEQGLLPLDEIANMYVCRDSGYFIGFAVTKDAVDGRLAVERMGVGYTFKTKVNYEGILRATYELEESILTDTVPDRDYGDKNSDRSNAWRCNYCGYAKLCKEDL